MRRATETLIGEVAGLGPAPRVELAPRLRRVTLVVVVVWAAILILVLGQQEAGPVLVFDGSGRAAFTLGLLTVAVFSGYRLGELMLLRRVERVLADLAPQADLAPPVDDEPTAD
jgi:hypothetical protein